MLPLAGTCAAYALKSIFANSGKLWPVQVGDARLVRSTARGIYLTKYLAVRLDTRMAGGLVCALPMPHARCPTVSMKDPRNLGICAMKL